MALRFSRTATISRETGDRLRRRNGTSSVPRQAGVPHRIQGRFHAPRKFGRMIETDPLTKLKLDALIEAESNHNVANAELLQHEYNALAPEQQAGFRNFLATIQKPEARWFHPRRIAKQL